jgi:hypothetical protein
MTEALLAQAQNFVDRKYVARADARQKSMGLAYMTAERTDLAREIANFAASIAADLDNMIAYANDLRRQLTDTQKRLSALRAARHAGNKP